MLVKRQARGLLEKLIGADQKDEPAIAKLHRYNAAVDLVRLAEKAPDGGDIVARRFVKSASRQAKGTRALLKLSDDELERFGYEALNPVSASIAYRKLLALVLKHSNESLFFRNVISTAVRDQREGSGAILYLAMEEPRTFFVHVDDRLVFHFCYKIITKQPALNPQWYCGVKLLCLLLRHSDRAERGYQTRIQSLLSTVLNHLVQAVTNNSKPSASDVPPNHFTSRGLPLLPLIAGCCERIEGDPGWEALDHPRSLKLFVELLMQSISLQQLDSRSLNTERGLTVATLISLFKIPSVVRLFSEVELSKFASFLVDMVLNSWMFEFSQADAFEKALLKPLSTKEDLCVVCLCSLPGPLFSRALSGALEMGAVRPDSPNTSPYEPLGPVGRLLGLSNMKMMEEQIHLALVDGGACEFLAHILNYVGDLDPEDRGLWRAKGLAMTCLGNIVERMNKKQFCHCVNKDMIRTAVAIKDAAGVPLVQKGQAIFLLQRYTMKADRLGVEPYHREDTSNMAEEPWKDSPGDIGSH
ncbi:hypothetical protein FRC01_006463 [Tulasnella sp. 417]|nr:hypothetical protein FRC01_006463 [Tulasnella sp. 417]